ncbi:MAG: hypothetical protein Q8R36_03890 [bacterium]|nr:hypothetical protein [bacterium]
MKNLNKNPLVWFMVVIALGWWATETGNFNSFVVFVSAIILAKQIEILSK